MAEKTKEKSSKKITRQTIIADAVEINEKAPEIFFKYGLHCVGCHVSLWETIEEGCQGHGMSDKDIDDMVEELNKKPIKAS